MGMGEVIRIETLPVMWGCPPQPRVWHIRPKLHFKARPHAVIVSAYMEGTIYVYLENNYRTVTSVVYDRGVPLEAKIVLSGRTSLKEVVSNRFYLNNINPRLIEIPKYLNAIRIYRPTNAEKVEPF